MIIRKITSQEEERAMQIYHIAFEQIDRTTVDKESRTFYNHDNYALRDNRNDWPDCDRYASFTDEGEMTAVATVWKHRIRFDGNIVDMGGIGGVACLPQYRKKGAMASISRAFLTDMYTDGVFFSYLFPFSTEYYNRYGYSCCGTKVIWTLDLQALRTVDDSGTIYLYEGSEEDFNAIKDVYYKYTENFNMAVLRLDTKFRQYSLKTPDRDGYYTYLYRDDTGKPKAVMSFVKKYENDKTIMDCDNIWFLDKHSLLQFLNFAKGFKLHYNQIRFTLPSHINIHDLVSEWCIYDSSCYSTHLGMGRVINAQSVLEMARYRNWGKISIKLTDPVISENEGIYSIDYSNGKATSVKKVENATPDVTLSINTFSKLILGDCDSSDTVDYTDWRDGMTVHNPTAPFKDIFYQKPLFIMDSFW